MAVPGLPSADSLLASIAALRRTLTTQEAGFRASVFTANSTDGKVTATAVEIQLSQTKPPAHLVP